MRVQEFYTAQYFPKDGKPFWKKVFGYEIRNHKYEEDGVKLFAYKMGGWWYAIESGSGKALVLEKQQRLLLDAINSLPYTSLEIIKRADWFIEENGLANEESEKR